MSIPNVTFLPPAGQTQAPASNKKILDKDDFLRLLVTKLSHQDPMNPVEDEDFAAQLAQFSSLEQMKNMNDNLSESIQWNQLLSQTINNTMATSLIGREVRADGSQIYLGTNGSADLAYSLETPATELTITIRDENGQVVRTFSPQELDAGDHTIHWDGANDSGAQAGSGVYFVSITAKDAAGNSLTPDQFIEGKVTGITYRDGIALLNVSGQLLPLAMVREVREG